MEDKEIQKQSKSSWLGLNRQKLPDWIGEIIYTSALAFTVCVLVRGTVVEARSIPSGSMEPTLQVNDRILVEKLSHQLLSRNIQRGDILVFYPPSVETGVPDCALARVTRLIPFLPENPPAFIKRVVGLPGDHILVKRGAGFFVNGRAFRGVDAVSNRPDYDLINFADIGGVSMDGKLIHPCGKSDSPVVVPPGHLFMVGDNCNNSSDSHVWGFLDEKRVVGRAWLAYWRNGRPTLSLFK
jgi:signal peptidase I